MRVLLLNYEYPPQGGGAGFATAELASRLARRGIVVDVVTSQAHHGDDGEGARRDRMWRHVPQDGLTVYRVRGRRRGIHQVGYRGAVRYLFSAMPVIRRLVATWDYDVVHVFFSLPTGVVLPFAGLRGARIVVSLRGSDVPGYDSEKRSLQLAHSLLRPVTRWIWRRADRVVAVCDALGRLAQSSLPGLSCTVIPNGVDLELFHPAANVAAPREGPVRCIAVARLVGRKGIADLLHAWQRLERGRCLLEIVGSGPEEGRVKTLVETMGLSDEVQFSGPLSREQLAERYRSAHLFTLAPLVEAFGNVFAEAMASGLPIVGTNIGGIPELVKDGVNGLLVPPGDREALRSAIERLAGDDALRLSMALRNRAEAERSLSWEWATERYLALYDELLESKAPRSGPLSPAFSE